MNKPDKTRPLHLLSFLWIKAVCAWKETERRKCFKRVPKKVHAIVALQKYIMNRV